MPRIVIDPGHGGEPGAIGHKGSYEKDINLRVAQKVYEQLYSFAEVKLTREDDRRLGVTENEDLKARAKIANDFKADVFVSIHCNAAGNPNTKGTEVFHFPGSVEGGKLAKAIQSSLIGIGGLVDRGVKANNFAVLRETKMPAVLVELAFISNLEEEKLLSSDAFQNQAAKAIVNGIYSYLGLKTPESNNNAPQVPSWASKQIDWAFGNNLINERAGSHDFYRNVVTLYNYHRKFGGK